MSAAAIIALLEQFASLGATLIGLANEARAGASETDKAKIDAALAKIQPQNDALHDQVQGLS